ncbi:MAG TPA: (deoxy)nucleoside triphosphate pyrophosphohydrolase [Candidatus Obscuribacter sp.]|nr:(deoxy)nucleoside triphosphate pyrophosphohydrolase [Candidatus Obscuribacter sp.]
MRTPSDKIRVLAAVVQRDGRYLICQRPEEKRHGLYWEFPGGKVEAGEDHGAAAVRELKEELNLNVLNVGTILYSANDPGSSFIVDFVNVEVDGIPVLHEHCQLRWLKVEELKELKLAPSDLSFLENYLLPLSNS